MGKIAVIDSGIGGLTVAKEIMKQMPNEDIVYFGDQKNCPYGSKTKEEIHKYVFNIVDFLTDFDIKALVIACNTATSIVLNDLLEYCNYPVIGVIEPGSQCALERTRNKKIGVMATVKTIESGVYERTLSLYDSFVKIYSQSCPKIVPLIEEKDVNLEELHLVLEEYLFPFKEAGIDTLVLGCTHYPIVKKTIKSIMGENVNLIDPAIRTTTKLKEELYAKDAYITYDKVGDHLFFTSGDPDNFDLKASKLLGIAVSSKKEEEIFSKKDLFISRKITS
jgi:glutamate racemase